MAKEEALNKKCMYIHVYKNAQDELHWEAHSKEGALYVLLES